MHFERQILPFKMHKIIFFPENLKKKVSPVNLGRVGYPKHRYFLIWPNKDYMIIHWQNLAWSSEVKIWKSHPLVKDCYILWCSLVQN